MLGNEIHFFILRFACTEFPPDLAKQGDANGALRACQEKPLCCLDAGWEVGG